MSGGGAADREGEAGPGPGEEREGAGPSVAASRRRAQRDDDAPVLPDRAAEDRPETWGERPDLDDDERYLRERPPHW